MNAPLMNEEQKNGITKALANNNNNIIFIIIIITIDGIYRQQTSSIS